MSAADRFTLLCFGAAVVIAVGALALSVAWVGVSVPLFFI